MRNLQKLGVLFFVWGVCAFGIEGPAHSLEEILNALASTRSDASSTVQEEHSNGLLFDNIMTKEEQEETGITILSVEQKKALEKWLTQWSIHFATTTNFLGTQEVVDVLPSRETVVIQEKTEPILRLKKIYENTMRLELNDSSVWNVLPVEYQFVMNWLPKDIVTIERSGDIVYPYLIHNKAMGHRVKAKLFRQPFVENEVVDIVNQELMLHTTLEQGAYVFLDDGSTWEVHPEDRVKAWRWQLGEKLLFEEGGKGLYPYRIKNIKTGGWISVRTKYYHEYPETILPHDEQLKPIDNGVGFPKRWDYQDSD